MQQEELPKDVWEQAKRVAIPRHSIKCLPADLPSHDSLTGSAFPHYVDENGIVQCCQLPARSSEEGSLEKTGPSAEDADRVSFQQFLEIDWSMSKRRLG